MPSPSRVILFNGGDWRLYECKLDAKRERDGGRRGFSACRDGGVVENMGEGGYKPQLMEGCGLNRDEK